MPDDSTSTACGAKWKSFRKLVVVSPAANFSDAAMAAQSSRLVGMPFSCVQATGRCQWCSQEFSMARMTATQSGFGMVASSRAQ